MSHKTKRALIALICFFALGLVLFVQQRDKPLIKLERQLVGSWANSAWQEDGPKADYTFNPDRTFHANDQQFFGYWKITGDKLSIEYRGERVWAGSTWLKQMLNGMKPPTWMNHQLKIVFSEGGKSAQLTELRTSDVSKLIRWNEGQ